MKYEYGRNAAQPRAASSGGKAALPQHQAGKGSLLPARFRKKEAKGMHMTKGGLRQLLLASGSKRNSGKLIDPVRIWVYNLVMLTANHVAIYVNHNRAATWKLEPPYSTDGHLQKPRDLHMPLDHVLVFRQGSLSERGARNKGSVRLCDRWQVCERDLWECRESIAGTVC